MAAARRLEVSTLHSKLTPWVVLDETYLGAYGRVRGQYRISGLNPADVRFKYTRTSPGAA